MVDYAKARAIMVDRQIRPVDVTDRRVIAAFGDVPRELFVPRALRPLAYSDTDLPLQMAGLGGVRRRLVGPALLARLLQLAEVGEGDIVLDVGCATGYSSAVAARLASSVLAVESDPALAAIATQTLIDIGIGNAAVITGALEAGFPDEAPYDVVLMGGSIPAVPKVLTDQLRDGGRLVAVIGTGPSGTATLFRRSGQDVSSWPAFSAPASPLPGFAPARSFAF